MNIPPRYVTADAELPGSIQLWKTATHQSDAYAFETAQAGTGGPFGAQLWLVDERSNEYVLIGGPNSNAVVSKGLASAHAEHENLCPEARAKVKGYLQRQKKECSELQRNTWSVVQVSSGESCHSCRSKQIAFAQELVNDKLIAPGHFFVVFKACYERTRDDAGFNDLPYDMTYRVANVLKLFENDNGAQEEEKEKEEEQDNQSVQGGIELLEREMQKNPMTRACVEERKLIYTPVKRVLLDDVQNEKIRELFREHRDCPFSVVVGACDEKIISSAVDERGERGEGSTTADINEHELTSPVLALHRAAGALRKRGVFDSWNLQGAILYTNVPVIGPLAYGETLWFNVAEIKIVTSTSFTAQKIHNASQEIPGMDNNDYFRQCVLEYNDPRSVMKVKFLGSVDQPSVAHLYWKAKIMAEDLLREETFEKHAKDLTVHDATGTTFSDDDDCAFAPITGSPSMVFQQQSSSHYNGRT